jgi:hypothetical protein
LLLRKPRNPCNGELTSRETAPFLIPMSKIVHDNLDNLKYLKLAETKLNMKEQLEEASINRTLPVKERDVKKLHGVHKLRSEINRELEYYQKVVDYKKEQLQLRPPPAFNSLL